MSMAMTFLKDVVYKYTSSANLLSQVPEVIDGKIVFGSLTKGKTKVVLLSKAFSTSLL